MQTKLAGLALVVTAILGAAAPAEATPVGVTSLTGSYSEVRWIQLAPPSRIDLLLTGTYRGVTVLLPYDCGSTGVGTYDCHRRVTTVDGIGGLGAGGAPESFTLRKTITTSVAADAGDTTIPTSDDTGLGATAWTGRIFDGLVIACTGYSQRSNADWDYSTTITGGCSTVPRL